MSHQLCRSKSDIDRHKNLSEGHNVKLVSGPIFFMLSCLYTYNIKMVNFWNAVFFFGFFFNFPLSDINIIIII